jgi:hypothetical protein
VHYDEQKREKFPGGNRDMASVAGLGDEGWFPNMFFGPLLQIQSLLL